MAAPTSTNEVTARKLSASISALWTKIKSMFQPTADRVTSWSSTTSDTKYPSEKLVKDSLDAKIPFDYSLLDTNPFGGKHLYLNYICNAMYSMDYRYFVTVTRHKKVVDGVEYPRIKPGASVTDDVYYEDSPVVSTVTSIRTLFNGDYEGYINIPAGEYLKVHIQFSNEEDWTPATGRVSDYSYNYGTYYLSFYWSDVPAGAQWRCYNTYAQHTVGWKQGTFGYFAGNAQSINSVILSATDNGNHKRTCIEFIVFAKNDAAARITQIDWKLQRPTISRTFPFFTNFANQNSYVSWYFREKVNSSPTITLTPADGNVKALSFEGKLKTSRKLAVSLSNTSTDTSFDGSADVTNIKTTGTLGVGNGGTGKTTAKAAEYNLTTGKSEISDTTSGDDRVVFELASPSESNGVTRGFRKLSTIWAWIKGLLSSESGVNISGSSASCTGNAATATALASGGADRTKLDGIAEGAEVNVQSDWNQTTTTADDYIKNKPTIPAAVRVKGNAESTYRTGDVNLTPANIGLTDAVIRGKISAGADLDYDPSTGVMKVDTTGTASGNYAFVSGLGTTASGNYSHAEGYNTIASSTSAHAEGSRTTASVPNAHAEGYRTTASGESAHAEGSRDDGEEYDGFSIASGRASHIEGINTLASGDGSHAEGCFAKSSGTHAHAEGELTEASGANSHAEGLKAKAVGDNSHSENHSYASGRNSHAEGYNTANYGAVGVASHAEGSVTFAYGTSAHAEGGGTNALGKDSHAEGFGGGFRPIAITLTETHVAETSSYKGSTEGLSVGMYLLWKRLEEVQFVSRITWIGSNTFGTEQSCDDDIPAGTVVYAVDRGAAVGSASHAEGFGTTAIGNYSHAEGYLTKAIGEASHAEGQGTEARTGGMHAAGIYPATKEGFARVTGWGSAATPKDIERLSTQGTLWVGGHFYGATPLKVVPGYTTYDEVFEAWSEQRPFIIEASILTNLAHALYVPADIRAVPLDQDMNHWEFHFKFEYPYNYRASFYAGGQEPYKMGFFYVFVSEQAGWGKLVSATNEWAPLSDPRWYSVPVDRAAVADTATEARDAAAYSPLANAIAGKSDVGHKHPISDLTMGVLSPSLGGTGHNNLSDACSAILKAPTLGTDTTMYADDEIMGSNHSSGQTDASKFVRRKASTMKAYVLNGGTMTGQFTNSYQGYGYQASHGTSNKYVGFKAYREDTQVGVSLEVGSNGRTHGVYSSKLGTWLLCERDDSKVHLYNDRIIINENGSIYGSDGVVAIVNSAGNAGGVLSAGSLRQTAVISKTGEFEVKNTDASIRGNGQLYFYRNTNATTQILAKWHVNSSSTFASGYIQPGCTGVFQLVNDANNYFSRIS